MAAPAAPARPPYLTTVETKTVTVKGVVGPNVYAYGDVRPMNRIRAYSSAGLSPFAGRGNPSEFHLIGHVHVDAGGKVSRIEGFNGLEGEAWAKQAAEKLTAAGVLAEGAVIQPVMPLKLCAFTGFR